MLLKPSGIFAPNRVAIARTKTAWAALLQDEGAVRDLVRGDTFPIGGTRIDSDEGRALAFNGTTQATLGAVSGLPAVENIAIIARVRSTGVQGGNPGAAFGVYNNGLQYGIGIGYNGNAVGGAWINSGGAGTAATVPMAQGRWCTVIVQGDPNRTDSGGIATWVDGAPAVRGGTTVAGATVALNEVVIGAQHRDSGYLRWFKGDVLWSAILVGDSPLWMTDEIANDLFASGYPYNLQASSRRLWTAAGSGPVPVAPPLLTNSQALHAPSVGRGAVALSAPLLSSGGVMYAATVGRGSVAVSPPLLASTATLFAPVVASVSAALRPPVLDSTSALYAPDVARGAVDIGVPLMASGVQLFAPAVGTGGSAVAVPLLVNGSVVHAPSVQPGAVAISAPLLVSAGAVYAPSVGAGSVQLMPPLLANTQIFYAPSVAAGREPGPVAVSGRRIVSAQPLSRTVAARPLNRRVGQ